MKAILQSIALVAILSFLIQSCGTPAEKYDGYVITGNTTNYPAGTKVALQKVLGKQVTKLDTTSVDANGNFQMKGKVDDKGFAQIVIGRNQAFVVLENEPITLTIDRNNARQYTLSGNPEMDVLQQLTNKVSSSVLDRKYLANFADTVSSPYLAYVAMQYLKPESDMAVFEKVNTRFQNEAPESPIGKQLTQFVKQTKASLDAQKKAGAKTQLGALAPDIDLPNPDNKNMKLSNLRGKVVLVDFWASWCGPCRRENPNVVRLYDKYKNKGFEVYSVSLDSRVERWKGAIEKDNLKWPYHVSDLQKWKSAPAAMYGVRSIPSTFLLDKEGKIIGKNLRGSQLEAKLAEIFNEA